MNTLKHLQNKRTEILAIAARHGAGNVRVFGSVVRGEDTPDSDIDFLVDMQQGKSLYDLIGFQQDVQDLLKREVDVLTERGVNAYLKEKILNEAQAL